jgi:hypothetical protein
LVVRDPFSPKGRAASRPAGFSFAVRTSFV